MTGGLGCYTETIYTLLSVLEKMKISEIFPQPGHIQRIYCDVCGSHMDLVFSIFNEEITGIQIHIKNLPFLRCEKCNIDYLPEDSRFAIIYAHEQATKQKEKTIFMRRSKTNLNFGYTNVPFLYDSDDYRYIPGLKRSNSEGFLTPVFFNREVLVKYDASPVYRLNFASRTYGAICRGEDYSISFGINKNGKVLMWLGDIATLPESEQYYLRSENIESDHSIGSEFYDGQIECIFTDKTPEDHLFECRSKFLESCFNRFGIKIAHLDKEVLKLSLEFNPPVVDSEKEQQHIANALNKIYVESFDNGTLGTILESMGEDPKEMGGLKRLQRILELTFTGSEVSSLMAPLFVLYDLRVAYSHLGSEEGKDKRVQSIHERLSLDGQFDFIAAYKKIIHELADTFKALDALF
jgi:hypothetical protein